MDLRSVAGSTLTDDIKTLKQQLRAEALSRRDALAPNDRRLWSEDVAAHVLALPAFGIQRAPWPASGPCAARSMSAPSWKRRCIRAVSSHCRHCRWRSAVSSCGRRRSAGSR